MLWLAWSTYNLNTGNSEVMSQFSRLYKTVLLNVLEKKPIRRETPHNFHQNENKKGKVNFLYQGKISLKSMYSFGEWVLSIFLEKIMVAIFDLNASGRLGWERNLYQGKCTFPTPSPQRASISKSNQFTF